MDFKIRHFERKLEGPLLLKVPERYFEQRLRVVFVGQQTRGWKAGEASIDELLEIYEKFDFGRHYNASPFWNVIRKFEQKLGILPYSSLWTNINRFDENGIRPKLDIENELSKFDDLAIQELAMLNPEIVIFFTGKSFDYRIKKMYRDANFIAIAGAQEGLLARIDHKNLPRLSFRTHHPKSLRIRRNEELVINLIIGEIYSVLNLSEVKHAIINDFVPQ